MNNDMQKHMTFNEDEMFHIFTSLFDIVFLMKLVPPNDFLYLKVSESAKKLALLKDEDIGRTISEIFNKPIAEKLNKHYYEAVQKKGPITYRDQMNTDHEVKYGETVLIPFYHNESWFVVGLTRDITNVVHLEQRQANDPITGLPFADSFSMTLNGMLRLKKNEGSIWSLFYISITQLSFVQYSDQDTEVYLLKQIANRLTRFLKQDDLLSRVSGNEFVLAIRVRDMEECKDLANQIYESLNSPFQTEDFETIVNPSIGVTIVNSDTHDIQAGMTSAFQAMLRAKAKPEKQIVLPFDTNWPEDNRKFTLERDIIYALQKKQFELYYQPKIDIYANCFNTEALLRWNHPSYGMIPPNEFIPILEKNQLIKVVGKWIIEQVCKDYKDFYNINSHTKIAINISPVQLNDTNFVNDIKQIVKKQGVDPEKIELEITESDLLNIQSAQKQFEALSKEGFRIVLDDFGTSYSSLNYLKELSVQKIKIDKSFIMNMDFLKKDQQIVQMIIKLAKNLDLEVTAEGVEKWEHVEMLTKMDCNEIQGYYISKPLPFKELVQKIKNNEVSLFEES